MIAYLGYCDGSPHSSSKQPWEFWILAILVGMFQGGIQALSRSYYGKIIPKDHAHEYYGFYDIFGKTASVLGTFLVATTTAVTGNASAGVLSIAVLLVAGARACCLCRRIRRLRNGGAHYFKFDDLTFAETALVQPLNLR